MKSPGIFPPSLVHIFMHLTPFLSGDSKKGNWQTVQIRITETSQNAAYDQGLHCLQIV